MKKYSSWNEYLDDLPNDAAERMIRIKEAILEVLPHATESMGYGVPAFDLKPKAKMNDKIMVAAFKNHIGLYPHPDTIEHFETELKPYKTLKGTIQFKYNEDLPIELIKTIVYFRDKQVN